LVETGYRPPSKVVTLPQGNGVIAVSLAKGMPVATTLPRVIHFSGYEWTASASGNDRGGGPISNDPANVWIDQKGYLHLHMGLHDGQWTSAEVNLNRSLGYGTYKFVVQDSAQLEPYAVLGMFTLDMTGTTEDHGEMDIELSRWGNLRGKNAQYVIQPFYVPENVARFSVPSGELTHSFQWAPGVASFKTAAGSDKTAGAKIIATHVFTSGVPTPAAEKTYIDLYDFHHSMNVDQRPAEVVIEKFEYLP
jgi:hypothetical protein